MITHMELAGTVALTVEVPNVEDIVTPALVAAGAVMEVAGEEASEREGPQEENTSRSQSRTPKTTSATATRFRD